MVLGTVLVEGSVLGTATGSVLGSELGTVLGTVAVVVLATVVLLSLEVLVEAVVSSSSVFSAIQPVNQGTLA